MMNQRNIFSTTAKRLAVAFLLVAGLVSASILVISHQNQANASIAGWNAGRIIDDAVFTNSTSMSASGIQSFLNSKVASCDTWGTQPSEFGGGTRRQWAEARGYSAPFTCLRDYSENGKSAARIIHDVAQEFSINPQVFLVLLQKEQSLVTDTWPVSIQYKTATGYGCPDTAPCDSQYFGLTNQLRWSGRMFRAIMNAAPTWYTPYVVGNNYIQYNPNKSCGGTTVNIQNRATQALYNYTPYQPNQGALNAGWGSADCGAYGNRNFYLYFNSWFGSPNNTAVFGYTLVSKEAFSDSGLQNKLASSPTISPNANAYFKVVIRNTGNQPWYGDALRIGTENSKNRSSEFANNTWISPGRPAKSNVSTVGANENLTLVFQVTAPAHLGTYKESFGVLLENQRWIGGAFDYTINVASSSDYYNIKTTSFDAYSDSAYTQKLDTKNIANYTNSKVYVRTKIQNTGNQTFPASTAKLAPSNPQDRTSSFRDESWLTGGRVTTANEGAIAPGATGTYEYTMTSPSTPTSSKNEHFGFLIEGNRWISQDVGSLKISVKERPPSSLSSNQSLTANSDLVSPNEKYRLVYQGDGNLVLYAPSGAIWNSKTSGRGVSRTVMQGDGNLVVYANNNAAVWNTRTQGNTGSRLVLQNDGNLVLYSAQSRALWHTGTHGKN